MSILTKLHLKKKAPVFTHTLPPQGSALDRWGKWIAVQLEGEGYPALDCQMAVDQYLSQEQVQNPALAQNLWSMVFRSGTVDARYLPPGVNPPFQVIGANPTIVDALATAIQTGDNNTADVLTKVLGMPPRNSVAAPILKGSTPLTDAPVVPPVA